ncbi:MAG: T9SS type A sorting domain-containing protein [Bacteroidales bacterium]|nr:T9SS type A sorting domain-containing protein [Bacteroidales bacterium]
MQNNKIWYKIFLIILTYSIYSTSLVFGTNCVQDDTLYVPVSNNLPVIDGVGNDSCWNITTWQTIDQVWIPLNTSVDSADFSGRFKVVWSSETNMLYFLAEVVDDIWVDGYVYNQPGPGPYQYDCFEIFFDEDRSGGLHLFDYFDDKGLPYGYNSENAFAYHIAVTIPMEGVPVTDFIALDGDGRGWADNHNVNYASHFDSLTVRRVGNVTTWEMALMVYDSSLNANPAGARVTLTEGKVSGLAVAYCDDDTPLNIQRQNFFGSVLPNLDYLDNNGDFNDTWINANHFGNLKLTKDVTIVKGKDIETNQKLNIKAYPNPVFETLNLDIGGNNMRESIIKLFDSAGNVLKEFTTINSNIQISMVEYPDGLYYLSAMQNRSLSVMKIVKIK